MDATGSETTLGDFEAPAFAKDDIGRRNAHVLHFDFHMAVWGVVIAEHGQVTNDVHAGCVSRHQNLGLLRITAAFKGGLAHHDRDLAARITKAGRPPFTAVDDIFIAIADDRGLDIGRIGRCNGRFGHQEGGPDFTVHQRTEILFFLFQRAVAVEHFHIAGVGRRAVEHFGGKADAAHFFGAQRIFQIGEARTFEFKGVINMRQVRVGRRHEQVPDPRFLGFLLLFLNHLQDLPAFAG